MLVIRRSQLEEFIARDDAELVSVVRRAVRAANGSRVKVYTDQQLDAMVKIGIDRARSRGLEFAEDIAAFVAIMFEVAPTIRRAARYQRDPFRQKLVAHFELRESFLSGRANPFGSKRRKNTKIHFGLVTDNLCRRQAGAKQNLNYAETIAKLEATVSELAQRYAKDRSEETRQAMQRRGDALLHVKNLSKGDPKARSRKCG